MFKNKKIGVVVPAHNEEQFVAKVIDGIPNFVDKIYVVNDASIDNTLNIILNRSIYNNRVTVVDRKVRGGVGAAVISGHYRGLKDGMDILAVMAGDDQMDPAFLRRIIEPIADGKADYVKGNRLSNDQHRKEMPGWRLFGNFILTYLTRLASGYFKVSDPQDGYTAISTEALKKLNLQNIEPGFAFENDLLVKLNVINARVMDIQHPAVYRGQRSKIHYFEFIINTSWILLKDCFWRIWVKYLNPYSTRQARKLNREVEND